MNRVILMGRLTRDPDVRTTMTGKMYARMTLAVDRQVKRDAPQGTPTADFINLLAWDKRAQFASDYLKKGTRILVAGRLQTGTYTDKEGIKRYSVEVVLSDIEFADSKKNAGVDTSVLGTLGNIVNDSEIPL